MNLFSQKQTWKIKIEENFSPVVELELFVVKLLTQDWSVAVCKISITLSAHRPKEDTKHIAESSDSLLPWMQFWSGQLHFNKGTGKGDQHKRCVAGFSCSFLKDLDMICRGKGKLENHTLTLTLKMTQVLERKTQILFLSIAVRCQPRLVHPKTIWQVAGLFPLIAQNWRQGCQTIPAGMASNMSVSERSPGLQLDLVKSLLDFLFSLL